ncbi:hypothetical protein [Kingella potus]|uniref:hypothetical protein n=1 Tax=Kingella potus TaxID=265175 RepID=UPI0011C05BE2|nr:hypothetical protein [Kingella potus]UOP00173.1 hypothetical protein LVJ84_09535 [Kingella potus]
MSPQRRTRFYGFTDWLETQPATQNACAALERHTLPKWQRPSETIESAFSDGLTFRLPRQIP